MEKHYESSQYDIEDVNRHTFLYCNLFMSMLLYRKFRFEQAFILCSGLVSLSVADLLTLSWARCTERAWEYLDQVSCQSASGPSGRFGPALWGRQDRQ